VSKKLFEKIIPRFMCLSKREIGFLAITFPACSFVSALSETNALFFTPYFDVPANFQFSEEYISDEQHSVHRADTHE